MDAERLCKSLLRGAPYAANTTLPTPGALCMGEQEGAEPVWDYVALKAAGVPRCRCCRDQTKKESPGTLGRGKGVQSEGVRLY